jgi:hypothetical protein
MFAILSTFGFIFSAHVYKLIKLETCAFFKGNIPWNWIIIGAVLTEVRKE